MGTLIFLVERLLYVLENCEANQELLEISVQDKHDLVDQTVMAQNKMLLLMLTGK